MSVSSYEFVAMSMNGHRYRFMDMVQVVPVSAGEGVVTERLIVKGVAHPVADHTEQMVDGHLAALASWIEDE